jgi:hypothetical protein
MISKYVSKVVGVSVVKKYLAHQYPLKFYLEFRLFRRSVSTPKEPPTDDQPDFVKVRNAN